MEQIIRRFLPRLQTNAAEPFALKDVAAVSFASVKSNVDMPGPRMMPTPAVPNACGAGLKAANASVLNHRATVRSCG